MANISLTQNNFGVAVNINLKDSSKKVVALTDCTASIEIVFPDGTRQSYDLLVLDAENGKVQLVVIPEMTAQLNIHKGYIEITSALSKITVGEPLVYNVMEEYGGA